MEGLVASVVKRSNLGLEAGSERFPNWLLLAAVIVKGWEPRDEKGFFGLELTSSLGGTLRKLVADVVLTEGDAIDPKTSGLAVVEGVNEGKTAPEAAPDLTNGLLLLPSGCAIEAGADDADDAVEIEAKVLVLFVWGFGLFVGGTSSSSSDKNEIFDWLLLA